MTDEMCGSVNPMTNMMKQFSQDRSLQREQFQGPSSSGLSTMRTQRPREMEIDMIQEFMNQEQHYQPPPTAFEFSALRRELPTNWAHEFEHHKVQQLTATEEANMNQIYQQHQTPAVWRDEFLRQDNHTQFSEFEAAFQHQSDWVKEFDRHHQWHQEFTQKDDDDDIIAKRVEEAATHTNFDMFDHLWADIQAELHPPYAFEANNPFLTHPDPLSVGTSLLKVSLSEAVLAFEAAVQRNHQDTDAWMQLGLAQAQNEKEDAAIRALEQLLEIQPRHTDALMALAISYTNESLDPYPILEQWITCKYPRVAAAAEHDQTRVMDLFLQAARELHPKIDPDVQIGLGVLCYKAGNYDKAIDCFASALKERPNDCLLWNRMGAVLASQGQTVDAIEAYHKALDIRPSFVRARYNIGLGYMRIGCYKEAVEHILTALSLHKDKEVNISTQLWDTLRKAFMTLGRRDLVEKAVAGTNLNQFRPEFEF